MLVTTFNHSERLDRFYCGGILFSSSKVKQVRKKPCHPSTAIGAGFPAHWTLELELELEFY
jgi:hypothetical protein